ncbi:MAG TPA: hypothetical protein ENL02_02735 [Epsilonproteobacteria bacterium]|nr:hypothetical protein [Campylobacterota bacterium]
MHLPKALTLLLLLSLWLSSYLQAGEAYQYSYLPKKVYENQLFPVTILELGSDKRAPHFVFDTNTTIKPIFEKPLVVKNGSDTFYTFYFKANYSKFHLPKLGIADHNQTITLDAADIPVAILKSRDDFCGVLAAEMKIKTSQASTYDGKNNLVTLSVEAFEANLENMKLKSVSEDGIENIERNNAKVSGEYYAVIPQTQKNIKFTYFNTIKGQYVFLEAPVVVTDFSVSTQSELNPKDDSFNKIKRIIFIGLSIFFLLLFLWKRDFFYLVIAVVSLITLLTFYAPGKEICVKQGATLYILPTPVSRISAKVDEEITVPLLGKRADYDKIEYQNGMIGWIKNEDICKN